MQLDHDTLVHTTRFLLQPRAAPCLCLSLLHWQAERGGRDAAVVPGTTRWRCDRLAEPEMHHPGESAGRGGLEALGSLRDVFHAACAIRATCHGWRDAAAVALALGDADLRAAYECSRRAVVQVAWERNSSVAAGLEHTLWLVAPGADVDPHPLALDANGAGGRHADPGGGGMRFFGCGSTEHGCMGDGAYAGRTESEVPSGRSASAQGSGAGQTWAFRRDPGTLRVPEELLSLSHWTARWAGRISIRVVVAGGHHTLLLSKCGRVWGIGSNAKGQLGLGPDAPRALRVRRGTRPTTTATPR